MAATTQTQTLQLIPDASTPTFRVSQDDTDREFVCELYADDDMWTVPTGTEITMYGEKPDGNVYLYGASELGITFSGNTVTIPHLDIQMTCVAGVSTCELRFAKNGEDFGSTNFFISVEPSPNPSGETSESSGSVFTQISEAVEESRQYSDAASASATAAAGSATSAQTSAGTATTAAGSATSAAEDAEDSADRAEAAAESMAAYNTDRTPYLLRQSGGGVETGDREYDTIVGGTVAWNQLADSGVSSSEQNGVSAVKNNDGSYTINGTATGRSSVSLSSISAQSGSLLSNHVYYCKAMPASGFTPVGSGSSVVPYAGVAGLRIDKGNCGIYKHTGSFTSTNLRIDYDTGVVFDNAVVWPQWIDLTQMFGSTIADYIYNLEQTTAGAGVAWFRQYFPEDYYEYNAGELKSVSGVSAHVMRDADENIIGNYPLDDSITLRGIPKLDGGKLYYDGDTYEADGTVTRKYGIVDLGSLTWTRSIANPIGIECFYAQNQLTGESAAHVDAQCICTKYERSTSWYLNNRDYDKRVAAENGYIQIRDTSYTDAAAFKTAMSGVYLVYELATPTSETAEPFTNPQVVEQNGTEEYVTDSIVPVGHDTRYRVNLLDNLNQILKAPTTDGTYTLKVTVSNGTATYSWTQ